jgi:hypothetical protein
VEAAQIKGQANNMNELLKATDVQLQARGLIRATASEYLRVDKILSFSAWEQGDDGGPLLHLQLADGGQREFKGTEAVRIAGLLIA